MNNLSSPVTTTREPKTDSRWHGLPPDPLAELHLYQGVMWRRILAYMTDAMIIAVILVPTWMIAAAGGLATLGLLWPLLWVLAACIPFAYHTFLIGGTRSATWGMRLFDIEVRDWGGGRPNLLQAAAMTAIFYISMVTFWLVLVIALFNNYHRTLHDFATHLVVVRNLPRTAAPSELMP